MRVRCMRCGKMASTNHDCKVCGSKRHLHHGHYFTGIHEILNDRNESRGWRWTCSCGGKGVLQYEEDRCGFGWLKHFIRAIGAREAGQSEYQDWMRQRVDAEFGMRAADIHKAAYDEAWRHSVWPDTVSWYPTLGHYPWTESTPD